jgi:hypothetical protein
MPALARAHTDWRARLAALEGGGEGTPREINTRLAATTTNALITHFST